MASLTNTPLIRGLGHPFTTCDVLRLVNLLLIDSFDPSEIRTSLHADRLEVLFYQRGGVLEVEQIGRFEILVRYAPEPDEPEPAPQNGRVAKVKTRKKPAAKSAE